MPGYRGHMVIASICFASVVYFFTASMLQLSTLIPGFVFCMLGALFPDVDVKSKGQKIFYVMLVLLLWYCLCTYRWDLFMVATFLGLLPILVRHRGLFHNIWFLFFITISVIACLKTYCFFGDKIGWQSGLFFLLGAVSHVLADRTVSFLKRVF